MISTAPTSVTPSSLHNTRIIPGTTNKMFSDGSPKESSKYKIRIKGLPKTVPSAKILIYELKALEEGEVEFNNP